MSTQQSLTEVRLESIVRFCDEYTQAYEKLVELRGRKRESVEAKKKWSEVLKNFMVDNDITCIPVPMIGEKYFLRLVNSTGHKQVGSKTLI
jgi:hypothetical protein